MEKMKHLFTKDFSLVVIGQIISMFGNQILQFALPLYLLNETNSSTLFGAISAVALIPMVILCPIGGLIADRVNKRNIMVILDFSTALITILYCLLLGKMEIVPLTAAVLIVLFGIQGTYGPTVQASIPALLGKEEIVAGNAVINMVSGLSNLIGPVAGGAIYSFVGIRPILYMSGICFTLSAIMEIFIHIPMAERENNGTIISIAKKDLKESFSFIVKEKPIVLKACLLIAAYNLIMTSLVMIGLPVIITHKLGFVKAVGNRLYGFVEGSIAIGGLIGGVSAGVFLKKIQGKTIFLLYMLSSVLPVPIPLALQFLKHPMEKYVVILITCGVVMIAASMFSIQMMSALQIITPKHLLGKVISYALCIAMCVQPIGRACYGILFEHIKEYSYLPFYGAIVITLMIGVSSKKLFREVDKEI